MAAQIHTGQFDSLRLGRRSDLRNLVRRKPHNALGLSG